MRRPEEVAVVIVRPGAAGREYLVLERAPEKEGYWHLVSGALEPGEQHHAAAARELAEETGLDAPVTDTGYRGAYALADEPERVRALFAPDVREVSLAGFVAAAPQGWEPELDWEHVGHRWLPIDEAMALVRYPEAREALRYAEELEA